jgi:hypothetical protein
VKNPEVASQWCYKRNCGWDPDDFSHGSTVKAWWTCTECHRDYQSAIHNRVCNGSGCPYCASKKVCEDNALSVLFPEIAKQFDSQKNKKAVTEYTYASDKKVWWRCPKNKEHSWQATPADRTTLNSGCPHCYEEALEYARSHPAPPKRYKHVLGETDELILRKWHQKWDFISLADSHPEVAAQWHPTKNSKWTPADFPAGSQITAWWQCPKDKRHEWPAPLYSRTGQSKGCPVCAGIRVVPSTSLQTLMPALAAEWHPQRNGNLQPGDVAPVSGKSVWWQCTKEHEWRAKIYVRAKGQLPCRICLMDDKSLLAKFPEVATEWHPTKNGKLTAHDVMSKSSKSVWWRCKYGHSWQALVGNRTENQSGCPYCTGRRASKTNCLAATRSDVAAQWHPTKNGNLKPTDVTTGSTELVWWQCDSKRGHAWQQTVINRTRRNSGCPTCFPRKRLPAGCHYQTLDKSHPDIARQWYFDKNGDCKPSDFTMRSGKTAWWKCPEGADHVWEANIASRTQEGSGGCPYCRGLRVSITNNLARRFPKIAAEWHPKKNGELKPTQVVFGSNKRVWWLCQKEKDHEWESTVFSRTGRGSGCPFCSGRRACRSNSIATEIPKLKKLWHPTRNGDLSPFDVTRGSSREIWWQCPIRGEHVWIAVVTSMVRSVRSGTNGCPYCRGLKVSRTNSLSYEYPRLAKEWHPTLNKDLTPRDVPSGSNKYVWWLCRRGHKWKQQPNMRAARGYGCPECRRQ